MVTKLYF